ncbi:MAG: hypothetical protein AAGE43_20645, partial [Pseudomonadota bacterium]
MPNRFPVRVLSRPLLRLLTPAALGLLLAACAASGPEPGGPAGPTGEERRVGALVLKDVPEVPAEVVEDLRRYQNTRSASVRGWLDES